MFPRIDPKVDYAFKRLFGSPQNRDILIAFLNAVLRLPPQKQIVEVELLNPFNDKETSNDKLSVVDVKVRDPSGRFFIVEMQLYKQVHFPNRVLYYWARLYQQQLSEGDGFEKLQPTYTIAILNDRHYAGDSAFHRVFQVIDPVSGKTFSDDFEVHMIELPKFVAAPEQVEQPLEAWCYFLKHAVNLDHDQLPKQLDSPPIHRAMEVLKMISEAELERFRYEDRLKASLDRVTHERWLERELAKARGEALSEGRNEGLRAGLEEGRTEGLQEGRTEGLKEGLKEGRAEGILIGQILALQKQLGQIQTPLDDLAGKTIGELQQMLGVLETQAL
jgi:predicted transposase/invertase (TIGR01784 family)